MIERECKLPKNNSFFLLGARGVGKSTLLRTKLLESTYLSINLLRDDEYYQLSQRPDSLLDRVKSAPRGARIVIDEVQRVLALLNLVHLLIEERGLLFAVTGSSSRKLKRGGANMLAGRAHLYELFPLTYTELKDQLDLLFNLRWGSLPALLSYSSDAERAEYLSSYVETYLREEIVAEQLVRNLPPFRRFLDIAAQMNCKILNYTAIAREVGVTSDTIKQYFAILEETHVGVVLDAYHTSVRKRLRQAPKFYFFDCGIPRAIQRQPGAPLNERTSLFGEIFEQFIVLELMRANSYKRTRAKFSYLRTKDDAEIDLIIELPGKAPLLIEIKSSQSIAPEDITTLNRFAREIPNSGAWCLSRDPISKQIGDVNVVPWEQGIASIFANA